jgi:hypothetical protein
MNTLKKTRSRYGPTGKKPAAPIFPGEGFEVQRIPG